MALAHLRGPRSAKFLERLVKSSLIPSELRQQALFALAICGRGILAKKQKDNLKWRKQILLGRYTDELLRDAALAALRLSEHVNKVGRISLFQFIAKPYYYFRRRGYVQSPIDETNHYRNFKRSLSDDPCLNMGDNTLLKEVIDKSQLPSLMAISIGLLAYSNKSNKEVRDVLVSIADDHTELNRQRTHAIEALGILQIRQPYQAHSTIQQSIKDALYRFIDDGNKTYLYIATLALCRIGDPNCIDKIFAGIEKLYNNKGRGSSIIPGWLKSKLRREDRYWRELDAVIDNLRVFDTHQEKQKVLLHSSQTGQEGLSKRIELILADYFGNLIISPDSKSSVVSSKVKPSSVSAHYYLEFREARS